MRCGHRLTRELRQRSWLAPQRHDTNEAQVHAEMQAAKKAAEAVVPPEVAQESLHSYNEGAEDAPMQPATSVAPSADAGAKSPSWSISAARHGPPGTTPPLKAKRSYPSRGHRREVQQAGKDPRGRWMAEERMVTDDEHSMPKHSATNGIVNAAANSAENSTANGTADGAADNAENGAEDDVGLGPAQGGDGQQTAEVPHAESSGGRARPESGALGEGWQSDEVSDDNESGPPTPTQIENIHVRHPHHFPTHTPHALRFTSVPWPPAPRLPCTLNTMRP